MGGVPDETVPAAVPQALPDEAAVPDEARAGKQRVDLGDVQQTLLIPLVGRARETGLRRPILRDLKAVEMLASIDYDAAVYGRGAGGRVTVLRTAIFDYWVRRFLADHPRGTIAEIGTGLNTRFERADNGQASWIDLDLPDTIALRRSFFTDTDRRQMVAASFLDEDWLDLVAQRPGPYFFVAEGVLVYLPPEAVTGALARIARRFPDAYLAFDTYSRRTMDHQHRAAARRNMPARWAWACDDPRALDRLGLRVRWSGPITAPPRAVRHALPGRVRRLLPVLDPVLGKGFTVSLFQAEARAGGQAAEGS
jgi:O-methyltransferase involved in polyketide biosynthesis